MGQVVVAGPNEAVVVTGPRGGRTVVGGCLYAMPIVDEVQRLSLGLMTLTIHSHEAECASGVQVSIEGVCQVKIDALDETDTSMKMTQNKRQLNIALQHYLGKTHAAIEDEVTKSLEGYQRGIIGQLTMEELYKDRDKFVNLVKEQIYHELLTTGMKLVSYVVAKISDKNGYMESLGKVQLAQVKREAQEGRAYHESLALSTIEKYISGANIEAADCERQSHVVVAKNQEQMALSDRDLGLKQSQYQTQVSKAQAEASSAFEITKQRTMQEEVRAKTQQELIRSEVMVSVSEAKAITAQTEMRGVSNADLLTKKNDAEAMREKSRADAHQTRCIAEAQAEASRLQGIAEADVMNLKAAAYNKFGDAAVTEAIVRRLPELAAIISKPLERTEKLVFVSKDGTGPSRLTKDIVELLKQVPGAIEDMTGINYKDNIQRMMRGEQFDEDDSGRLQRARLFIQSMDEGRFNSGLDSERSASFPNKEIPKTHTEAE
eukprot:c20194_g1_i1.p1 GENE.c20194_g1_i1~~c20194_g1_i1.p1  ORF type:complete len:501 (+),score=134.68 c20194_g1_i1:36-1505(+)